MQSDPKAAYTATITLDRSTVPQMLAQAGDPRNRVAVSDLTGPVSVNLAYAGSCTVGKRNDFDKFHKVAFWTCSTACMWQIT